MAPGSEEHHAWVKFRVIADEAAGEVKGQTGPFGFIVNIAAAQHMIDQDQAGADR